MNFDFAYIETRRYSFNEIEKYLEDGTFIIDKDETNTVKDYSNISYILCVCLNNIKDMINICSYIDNTGRYHITSGINYYNELKDYIYNGLKPTELPGQLGKLNNNKFEDLNTLFKHRIKGEKVFTIKAVDYRTSTEVRDFLVKYMN